jgi:hypothetical protein
MMLMIAQCYLFATNVITSISQSSIYKGDSAELTIKVDTSSDNIKFPDITQIGSYPVQGISNSSSTSIINGRVTKQISKIYTITPLKSIDIPSYKVIVDGKEYMTKPQKITVIKPSKSKSGDEFIVDISLDKDNIRVGQSAILKVKFEHKLDAKAQKVSLEELKLENFWIKKIDGIKKYSANINGTDYIVQEFSYIIFAQKSGKYHISPIQADIGVISNRYRTNSIFNDPFFSSFGNSLRWKKVYSNELDISVEPLPEGLEVYGHFEIKSNIDKKEIKANKPVNLTIEISGVGNIEDIKKIDLDIDGATIYSDEPTTKTSLINDEVSGSFTQKIAIIGDRDFTIPSIEFKYFDKDTQSIKVIKTEPIDIKVAQSSSSSYNQSKPQIQTTQQNNTKNEAINSPKNVANSSSHWDYISFGIGVIVGLIIGIGGALFKQKNNSKENSPTNKSDIITQIKKAKDDKVLYEVLLPYINDDEVVKETLKMLEENIYKNTNHKIDKQKLYDCFL